jgi:hypothetical protein
MLTIFTTPKPFLGHIKVIQYNALRSWKLLHPDVEVILFGDDEGASEAARAFCLRHEPYLQRNDLGMKRLDYMFGKAQSIARHGVLCYVNCDIILLSDFSQALQRVREQYSKFLMVGHRWDTSVTEPIEFSGPDWADHIRQFALASNDQRNEWFIDYFAFARDVYHNDLPPFVIGTVRWDNWLIWKALNSRIPVVDVSRTVIAVHQNHDYSYHPDGKKGVFEGEEARRNFELAGGWKHLRNLSHATYELTDRGQIVSTWRRRYPATANEIVSPIWYSFLNATYRLRRWMGLNRTGLSNIRTKIGK